MKKNKKEEKLEPTKDRLINNILLIVILVLLVYILFATGIIKINTNNKVNKNEETENIEEKTKIKTTDPIINSLYKSIELGRSYSALRHYYFYSYDKLFVKYMDDAFIKEMALSKLTLQNDTSINANILESQFHSIVGNNTIYKNRTFQTQCSTLKYDMTHNIYNIIKNPNCSITKEENGDYFDKIMEAYKYSDRIEIITRVGYIEEEKELVGEGVYQSTGKTIVKKEMDSSEIIGTYTESLDQIKKIIDYQKLSKYKYTFRLDSNKYYFYSVEKVE